MDNNLAFTQASSPPALILPRRLSLHGGLRANNHQKSRHVFLSSSYSQDSTLENEFGSGGGQDLTHHYYYYPSKAQTDLDSTSGPYGGVVVSPPTYTSGSSSTTFSSYSGPGGVSVGNNSSSSSGSGMGRRHTISNGSSSAYWTSVVPPRHALHMPVMKIDPNVWRSEHHQQDIYRLMHEGRAEEVMKRRMIKAVMDTSEEGDEDEEPNRMDDVVTDIDLGGFKALENREKERARLQALQEWNEKLDRQQRQAAAEESFRIRMMMNSNSNNTWTKQLEQQQVHFMRPSQVLHPNLSQQQQMPSQLPAPGQQLGQGGTHRLPMMTTGPLAHPSSWSASPIGGTTTAGGIGATNMAFTVYR